MSTIQKRTAVNFKTKLFSIISRWVKLCVEMRGSETDDVTELKMNFLSARSDFTV